MRLLLPAVLAAACSGSPTTPSASFPAGFLFGVATAGFQHDPGCPTLPVAQCEDHGSDWYQWMTDPRITGDPTAYIAPGSISQGPGMYELYDADFARMRDELHGNAFRLSFEWSRLFPQRPAGTDPDSLAAAASPDALAYYHRLFAALRAHGLQPLVTINHYTLPLWIHDGAGCHVDLDHCSPRGWLDASTIDDIARYAGFVAREFGGDVDLWATLNEPLAVVVPGYIVPRAQRSNPPGVYFKGAEGRAVLLALIEAHARMYDAVHANDTVDADGDGHAALVGFANNVGTFVPKDPDNSDDVDAASDAAHLYNELFVDAVVRGDWDPTLSGQPSAHRDNLAGRLDWIGMNYYLQTTLQSGGDPFLPSFSALTTFDPLNLQTADHPDGLHDVLVQAKARWGLPIIVTENGLPPPLHDSPDGSAWEPQTRSLVQHLAALRRAQNEGVDVRGYFYWSLVDNIEWNMGMDGLATGLYEVDGTDPAKTRTLRTAGAAFARIAAGAAIPDDLAAKYDAH